MLHCGDSLEYFIRNYPFLRNHSKWDVACDYYLATNVCAELYDYLVTNGFYTNVHCYAKILLISSRTFSPWTSLFCWCFSVTTTPARRNLHYITICAMVINSVSVLLFVIQIYKIFLMCLKIFLKIDIITCVRNVSLSIWCYVFREITESTDVRNVQKFYSTLEWFYVHVYTPLWNSAH